VSAPPAPRGGAWSWLLLAVLILASVFAAWRIVALHQADRWASEDPQRALRWIDRHPAALLNLAERQAAAGDHAAAAATARRLLAVEPLQGRAFRILAEAALADDDPAKALALYRITARRSPRDLKARAWLADHALQTGDLTGAVDQFDALLRLAPRQHATLLPLVAQLAANEGFAAALAERLESRPPWRAAVLRALQRADSPRAEGLVLSALRRGGGLTQEEWSDWIEALMARGAWGEAYGRWAGTVELEDGRLQLVHNGGFERPASGRGFDWRARRTPGVSLEFVDAEGADGLAAHASFRGRRVAAVNLEQALLLPPGTFTFTARMRSERLRSELGLEWTITCLGQSQPIATSPRITGTTGWHDITMEVAVPADDCDGQWLRLRNPVRGGSAQQVSGDLWVDDVRIVAGP
jgi:tetratricopeptide (TPR) repeat protein